MVRPLALLALLLPLPLGGCSLFRAADDVHLISENLVRSVEVLEKANSQLADVGNRLDESNALLSGTTRCCTRRRRPWITFRAR